jgi:NAD(P)-dependent dehydrogenase (short-subunit alcohol dehydrogenase family)
MANTSPIYILITGVSQGGLGDALTTELLKRPDIHILASGLDIAHLAHLPSNDRISTLQLDVTSPTSISSAAATVTAITNGHLHYLITNAGYGYMMPLLDADAQAVKQNFEVNVFGLLAVTQAFFPLLRGAKGTVVNQCSIASLPGGRQPYIGTYCATKAAVASLNDTMRVEFAPFGVKVSSTSLMLTCEHLSIQSRKLLMMSAGHRAGDRRCPYWVLGPYASRSKRLACLFALSADRCSRRADDARRDKPTWPAYP